MDSRRHPPQTRQRRRKSCAPSVSADAEQHGSITTQKRNVIVSMHNIAEGAALYGLVKSFNRDLNRVFWRVVCAKCNAASDHGWGAETSPSIMVSNLRRAGWIIGRRKDPICPNCQKQEKTMTKSTTAAQIGPDPRIARKIYNKLDEYFDENTRRYSSGWSDEKIAKEIGASPDLVARIRRDAYGELAEDPAITQIKDEFGYVRLEFEEAMAALSKQFNEKLSRLEASLHTLPGVHKKAAG
jgi:AraC-like DNA-binding protein